MGNSYLSQELLKQLSCLEGGASLGEDVHQGEADWCGHNSSSHDRAGEELLSLFPAILQTKVGCPFMLSVDNLLHAGSLRPAFIDASFYVSSKSRKVHADKL